MGMTRIFDSGMWTPAGEHMASMAGSALTACAWRGDAWQVVGPLVHTMAAACTCGMCQTLRRVSGVC